MDDQKAMLKLEFQQKQNEIQEQLKNQFESQKDLIL